MLGISTNGLVFVIDPLNTKSYNGGVSTYNLGPSASFTLTNGVGFNGRDFTFDGINDYINVGNLGNGFSSFTMDIWFNSSSITNFKNLIDFNGFNTGVRIEQFTYPGLSYTWTNLGGSTGLARMAISLNGSGESFGIGGDLPGDLVENKWFNLIVSYNSTGQKVNIFLNGQKIVNNYTSVVPTPFVGYINNMRIGDGYDYSTRRFQGSISYVALYTRAITDTESINNYNTLKWRFI